MEKNVEVKNCFYYCDFFSSSMDGIQCNHPYWKDKGVYKNMIITHDNSKEGKIPEKCPLRNENLVITYKLIK